MLADVGGLVSRASFLFVADFDAFNVKDMCFWLNGPLAIEDHIAGDYVDQALVG